MQGREWEEDLFNGTSVEGREKRLGAGKGGNRNKSNELGKDK
jgi:hypothetical protein